MKKLRGEIILSITALIWGTAFVAQIVGMEHIGPFTFTASRTLIGALSLIPVILLMDRKKSNGSVEEEFQGNKKDLIKGGVTCGLAMFFGVSFQQVGLLYTTAGKAGFITALYIVLVPIFGLFMHKRIEKSVWLGVALGVVGLYLLSVTEGLSIGKGDLLVTFGTFFWALHIITIDHFTYKVDALKMSFIQFLVCGIIALSIAIAKEKISIEALVKSAFPVLYAGIIVVGIAYTLQIIGQRGTNPTTAAIIMSMESVFAAISGMIILGETMSLREIAGCILMFIAVIVAQLQPSIKKDEDMIEVKEPFN